MEWISLKDERKPESGRHYWITILMFGHTRVIESEYKDNEWYFLSGDKVDDYIVGWYPEAKPEPMDFTPNSNPYLIYPEFKVNENGINKKNKVHILPNDEMMRVGFTDCEKERWLYCKNLYHRRGTNISFNLGIEKLDPTKFSIDILNENSYQPYDYQDILSKNFFSNSKALSFAININNEVERIMEKLQKAGFLSGHVRGEYI